MHQVWFKIKYEAEEDADVRLVGCLKELGSWEPSQSLKLKNTDLYTW